MNPEQRAAYIVAQAACAMAEIAGMQAENQIPRASHADPDRLTLKDPPYRKADFDAVAKRYGLTHNAVLAWLRSG